MFYQQSVGLEISTHWNSVSKEATLSGGLSLFTSSFSLPYFPYLFRISGRK
jgi:hypothetical protein